MLTNQQINAIKDLIKEAENLILSINPQVPHDYTSLKEYILFKELEIEVRFLKNILALGRFEEQFKHRCSARAKDPQESALNFSMLPDSTTNKLYSGIAHVISPQHELELLIPNIQTVLTVDVPEQMPSFSSREAQITYMRNPDPELLSLNLTTLESEGVGHYVITDGELVDISGMSGFSLKMHLKMYHKLQEKNPELAQRVYRHNTAFQTLEEDILRLDNKGQTPREAIERLIKGLILGGKQMTGTELQAGKLAQVAYQNFLRYWQNLPLALQTELSQLPSGKIIASGAEGTLADTLQHLRKGECAEIAAKDLRVFLEKNKNKSILNQPPQMTEEHYVALHKKYKKSVLDTTKDGSLDFAFPKSLLKTTMHTIVPRTQEDLVQLILDFPPEYYKDLLAYIDLSNLTHPQEILFSVLEYGFFTAVQIDHLIGAIANKFGAGEKVRFALAAGKNDVVVAIVGALKKEDRFSAIQYSIHKIANNLKLLEKILSLLDEKDRLAAVSIPNSNSDLRETILYDATPERLIMVLSLLSPKDFFSALQVKDGCWEVTPLHTAIYNPESLKTIISLLPQEYHSRAREDRRYGGDTLLHSAIKATRGTYSIEAVHLSSIQILLSWYSSSEATTTALKAQNNYKETVLHIATHNSVVLKLILSSMLEKDFREIVQVKDRYGNTPLHNASNNSESLKVILDRIPPKERFAAVQTRNTDGKTILYSIVHNSGLTTLNIVLSSLSEDDLFKIIQETLFDIHVPKNKKLCQNIYGIFQERFPNSKLHIYCAAIQTILPFTMNSIGARALYIFSCGRASAYEANQLITAFENIESAEQLKQILYSFLTKNHKKPSALQKALLMALSSSQNNTNYSERLCTLSQNWGIQLMSLSDELSLQSH